MDDLTGLVEEVDDVLSPFGKTDVLLLYGVLGKCLKGFLRNKEIATRIWLPSGNIPYILKRGSKEEPLFIEDFVGNVSRNLIEKRKKFEGLEEARPELSEKEELIWKYFVPDKFVNFFYATNGEDSDFLERAYLDIDRGEGTSAEEARKITSELSKIIRSDGEIMEKVDETFVFWTGNSFHYYLFFKEKLDVTFYREKLRVSEKDEKTNVEEWINELNDSFDDIDAVGGHERVSGKISIDPSQTPPGKLGRIPLGSLHLGDAKTVDGFSIPLEEEMLSKSNLINKLVSYSAREIISSAKELGGRIPDV